jgi:hypothetical protein
VSSEFGVRNREGAMPVSSAGFVDRFLRIRRAQRSGTAPRGGVRRIVIFLFSPWRRVIHSRCARRVSGSRLCGGLADFLAGGLLVLHHGLAHQVGPLLGFLHFLLQGGRCLVVPVLGQLRGDAPQQEHRFLH